MAELYRTVIVDVGAEVSDLLDGGLLVLFEVGAPPELAEISVVHAPDAIADAPEPRVADIVRIGGQEATITAMGPRAWAKARDLGHLTFNFGGTPSAGRPGEICVSRVGRDALWPELVAGATISIRGQ